MDYLPDEKHCELVWAQDYLSYDVGRGRPFHIKHLGLTFYGLKDCLCVGHASQVIGPLSNQGKLLCIFKESCPYVSNEHSLDTIARNSVDHDEITVEEAVPLFPRGALNLWHWTFESFPKLLALESVGYSGQYIIPAEAFDHSVIKQSLALMKISPERLLASGPVYKIKRLMLPQRLSGFTLADNMPLTSFVRQQLIDAVGVLPGEKRLYVQRIGRRRIINEDAVFEVLNDFGFEVMIPEHLSLAEQWSCMTNVDCSVMPHGANSTLMLLQKQGAGAVELFSNRYVSYNNLHTVRLLGLHYYPLTEELDVSCYPDEQTPVHDFLLTGMNADLLVDPLHLRIALETIL